MSEIKEKIEKKMAAYEKAWNDLGDQRRKLEESIRVQHEQIKGIEQKQIELKGRYNEAHEILSELVPGTVSRALPHMESDNETKE